MCILVYYASKDDSLFSKKTKEFIEKNNGDFLVCHYIVEWDLPKWTKRQNTLIDEVVKKVKDQNYNLTGSAGWNSLYPREKQKAEKLILKAKYVKSKAEFLQKIIGYQKDIELGISNFIAQKAEKVMPVSEIDNELKSQLLTYLENNVSDSNIIASGIQEHNQKEVILLTADKAHWTKENLEWAVPKFSAITKKYPKIPMIKYLQDF